MNESGWSLERIRAEIDEVDIQILRLLERRAFLALRAKREKERAGMPVEDPARERQVIERIVQHRCGPLPASEIRRVFEAIIACCRTVQTGGGNAGTEVNPW
ncbi:MAG: chorismate mutase [candidate division KSB1 bacterium]|nr:chorismate mutase [candidate division KSB1 bacterium]